MIEILAEGFWRMVEVDDSSASVVISAKKEKSSMIGGYYSKINSIISSNENSISLQCIARKDPTILVLLVELFSVNDYAIIGENLELILEEHVRNDIAFMIEQCTCNQYSWPGLVCTYDKLAGTASTGTISKCHCCPFCRQKCRHDFLIEKAKLMKEKILQ
jgi:hypothetical protein